MDLTNIQQLVERKKLTQDGADWLRLSLDPFHDYARNFEGFPDLVSSKSKVQLKTSTISVSSPDGNPYSARVWTTPIYSEADFLVDRATGHNGAIDVNSGTSFGQYGLVVTEAWNGTSDPNSDSTGATLKRTGVAGKTSHCSGRLIALGIEVHNTTSPLYRSGLVTCSRYPGERECSTMGVGNTTSAIPYSNSSVHCDLLPPTTSSTALLVPGATQWEAEKGAYMVAHLASETLPVISKEHFFRAFKTDHPHTTITCCTNSSLELTSGFLYPMNNDGFHSFDLPYMIFEGLSAETSLTVTVRAYTEYFPTHMDADFMPFATPSPRTDMMALKLYGATAPNLPMAVPVNMNAAGDYFKMVMRALSQGIKIISPVIAAAFPELAPVAMLAGSAARVYDGYAGNQQNSRNQQKKKKSVGFGKVGGQPVSISRRK